MRAVAFADDHSLRVIELSEPDLLPDEVRIAVRFCGICGSDLHMREMAPAGVVLGHEFTGTIIETGSAVRGWAVGDRVTANPFDPCGQCEMCTAGPSNLCPTNTRRAIGMVSYHGAYAETVVAPVASLFRLPDELSDEHGALGEPLAVGLHGVSLSNAQQADTSLVLGAGPIGMMTALGLRATGSDKIILVEPIKARREIVHRLGFAVSEIEGQADHVRDALGGSPSLAFDCTGDPAGFGTAVNIVAPAGRVVVVGIPFRPPPVDVLQMNSKEVQIRGSYAYTSSDWVRAIDLLASGAIPARDIITTVAPLDEAENWYSDLTSGSTREMKVLLAP